MGSCVRTGSDNKHRIELRRIFVTEPSETQFEITPYPCGARYIRTWSQTSYTKVFEQRLIFHSRTADIYVSRETSINDTTVRTDCLQIGYHSSWEKTVPEGANIFPFSSAPRTCLGLKQPPPPIQWAPGSLFLGIKRPRRGFDLSLLSNAGLGMGRAVTPPPISLNGV